MSHGTACWSSVALMVALASPAPAEKGPPDPFAVASRSAEDWGGLKPGARWWLHVDMASGVLTLTDTQPGEIRLTGNVEFAVDDGFGGVTSRHVGRLEAELAEDGRPRVKLSFDTSPHERALVATGRVSLDPSLMAGETAWGTDDLRRGIWVANRLGREGVHRRHALTGERRRDVSLMFRYPMGRTARFLDGVRVDLRRRAADGRELVSSAWVPAARLEGEQDLARISYPAEVGEDRDQFQRFEYRTAFRLSGGEVITRDWKETRNSRVFVEPPVAARTLTLDGDFTEMTDVEEVTVEVFVEVAGAERRTTATVEPAGGSITEDLVLLRTSDAEGYDYEVRWKMSDGSLRTTGRLSGSDGLIYIDEVGEPAAVGPSGP